jgi:hypothetical protein
MYEKKVIPRMKAQPSNSSVSNSSGGTTSDSEKDQTAAALLKEKRDLLHHIESIVMTSIEQVVQPIEYQDYEQHIKYNTPLRKKMRGEDDNDENENDSISSTSSCSDSDNDDNSVGQSLSDSDNEIEEEDLIDPIALKKVKELRNQVRETAQRIQTIRDEKLQTVVNQVLVEMQRYKDLDIEEEERLLLHRQEQDERNQKSPISLDKMDSALKILLGTLTRMDVELPDKMESIQTTIETIETALSKKTTTTPGGTKSLSRTERAIQERFESEPKVTTESEMECQIPSSPRRRLASFMAHC